MKKEKRYGVELVDNKTYRYILPMLGDSINNFINLTGCFLGDRMYPDYDNHILLMFKHVETQGYLDFERKLSKHPMYAAWYKVRDFEHMYVFNVPIEHQRDYDLFKESKYSQLSELYKRQIITFHRFQKYGYGSSTIKILYRDEQLYIDKEAEINKDLPEREWTHIPRSVEIGEILHLDEEILNYNNIEASEKVH